MTSHSESELAFLSIEQAARLLRRREISPARSGETRRSRGSSGGIRRITLSSPSSPDEARRQARLAEREIRRGRARGPLHGIPISLKDNFWTRGIRTTAGSKILADFVPETDSDVAESARAAPARFFSARRTCTNSPTASRAKIPTTAAREIRGRANGFPADQAEDRRWPSARGWASLRWARTRAARSAFPLRFAESWA